MEKVKKETKHPSNKPITVKMTFHGEHSSEEVKAAAQKILGRCRAALLQQFGKSF